MRKLRLFAAVQAIVLCLAFAVSCGFGGDNPGKVKVKYWVSDDESIAFFFPAEAGIGKAQGEMIIENAVNTPLILEWDRNGKVRVTDADKAFLFSADTVTDKEKLTCTFRITEQSSKLNLKDKIVFSYKSSMPKSLTEPFKPENTSLDLWILQDTEKIDLSEYESIPGWFGAEEVYGKGYESVFVPGEGFADPEHCVKYLISAWPDYSDGGEFVTQITITDPNVTFFGLTSESPREDFDRILTEKGFTHEDNTDRLDPGVEYKEGWHNRLYSITLAKRDGKCIVIFNAPVTNRNNIIF